MALDQIQKCNIGKIARRIQENPLPPSTYKTQFVKCKTSLLTFMRFEVMAYNQAKHLRQTR